MRRLAMIAGAVLALAGPAAAAAQSTQTIPPHRPVVQHHWIGGDLLTLRSEPWFGGAVSSIRFRGVEFVNADDHGRLLQGALAFDDRLECLNPTQGGSSSDGRRRSTSRRLWAQVQRGGYASATRMAYWLRPGQTCATASGGRAVAANRTRLSDVTYTQRFTFGHGGAPNAVRDEITFTTGTAHRSAVVEAVTLYAPAAFDRFHLFDPVDGSLTEDPTVTQRPGEQARAVVMATADGRSAFAVLSLSDGVTYGRWRLAGTNKISLVFRHPGGYAAGEHAYRCVWVIGTLEEVRSTLRRLS